MTTSSFVATILGIPHIPSVVEVNVRSGPGIKNALTFKSPLRVRTIVHEVQPDGDGTGLNGKTYHWLRLAFPDGRSGWVRDDLIEVEGDGSFFGYGHVSPRMLAFALTRQAITASTPAPAVPTPATEPAPIVPPEKERATVINQNGANLRQGPSLNYDPPITRLPYNTRIKVLEIRSEEGGNGTFKWAKVKEKEIIGWIREDLLLFGDKPAPAAPTPSTNPAATVNGLYAAPMKKYTYIRGFNTNPSAGIVHHGVDYAAVVGEPVYAGPAGGTVVKVAVCQKCTPDRPSTVSQGYQVGDSRIFNDPAWNYGYGNYVIIRYNHEQLPASTRQTLNSLGFGGAHVFAMYAHLHTMQVNEGQTVGANAQFATNGNTGNSTGPHVHLEIRVSRNIDFKEWYQLRPGLLDPLILFLR